MALREINKLNIDQLKLGDVIYLNTSNQRAEFHIINSIYKDNLKTTCVQLFNSEIVEISYGDLSSYSLYSFTFDDPHNTQYSYIKHLFSWSIRER
jgi:hypothetical protein